MVSNKCLITYNEDNIKLTVAISNSVLNLRSMEYNFH